MTLNKLEINTDYIVRCEDFSVKAAKEATQRLLSMKNIPDAIFGIMMTWQSVQLKPSKIKD